MPGTPIRRARKEADARTADLRAVGIRKGDALLPTPRRTSPAQYSVELDEEIVALGAQGLGEAEIAAHWRLSAETLCSWRDEKPSFAEAYAQAFTASQAWWESQARHALAEDNMRFPAGAWSQVMRGRFPGYGDSLNVNVRHDITSRLVIVDLTTPPPAQPPIEGAAKPKLQGRS